MAAPSLVLHTPPSILPPLPSSPREALSLSRSLFPQISSPPHDKRSCQRSDQSGAADWVINSQHSVIRDWLSKSQTLEEQEFTTNTDMPAGAAPKTSANIYTEGKDLLNFSETTALITSPLIWLPSISGRLKYVLDLLKRKSQSLI